MVSYRAEGGLPGIKPVTCWLAHLDAYNIHGLPSSFGSLYFQTKVLKVNLVSLFCSVEDEMTKVLEIFRPVVLKRIITSIVYISVEELRKD